MVQPPNTRNPSIDLKGKSGKWRKCPVCFAGFRGICEEKLFLVRCRFYRRGVRDEPSHPDIRPEKRYDALLNAT